MNSVVWGLVITGTVVAILWYRGRKAERSSPDPSTHPAARTPGTFQQGAPSVTFPPPKDEWTLTDAETVMRPPTRHRSRRPTGRDR